MCCNAVSVYLVVATYYSIIFRIRQSKENAIRLLAALMTSTHAVVDKLVADMIEVLLGCSRDDSSVMIEHILICIGELSAMDDFEAVTTHLKEVMTLILTALEGDPQVRSAALDCLGSLATNTGYVITPIEEYPQLLPLLHSMLKREQSVGLRQRVIKIIGLLGALDPDRYQVRV